MMVDWTAVEMAAEMAAERVVMMVVLRVERMVGWRVALKAPPRVGQKVDKMVV